MLLDPVIGDRSGYLTLKAIQPPANGGPIACCTCDCGKFKALPLAQFQKREVTSCGCLKKRGAKAKLRLRFYTYRAYLDMVMKCYDPNHPEWDKNGKKGIEVCPQWLGDRGFIQFLKDMGDCNEVVRHPARQRRRKLQIWCNCSCPHFDDPDTQVTAFTCKCGEKVVACVHCFEAGRVTTCPACAEACGGCDCCKGEG